MRAATHRPTPSRAVQERCTASPRQWEYTSSREDASGAVVEPVLRAFSELVDAPFLVVASGARILRANERGARLLERWSLDVKALLTNEPDHDDDQVVDWSHGVLHARRTRVARHDRM